MKREPIETSRLVIRHFAMDDADDLYEILGDAETMYYCEPAYSFEKIKNFMQVFCIDRNGALAVEHKQSHKLIGYLLFHESESDAFEMGWFFNRNYWRQGYAYEACNALIDYAFHDLNAHRIFAESIDQLKSVGSA